MCYFGCSFLSVPLKQEEAEEEGDRIPQLKLKYSFSSYKQKECAVSRSQIQSGLGEHWSTVKAPIWAGWEMHLWVCFCLGPSVRERLCCQVSQHTAETFSLIAALESKAFSKPVKEVPRAHIYALMTNCKRRTPRLILYTWGLQGLLTLFNQNPFSLQHSKTLCEIKIVSLPNFLWVNYCSSHAKLGEKRVTSFNIFLCC